MGLLRHPMRRITTWWSGLSSNGRLLVACFGFNLGVMLGAGSMEYYRRRKLIKAYQKALVDMESEGMTAEEDGTSDSTKQKPTCFLAARMYRENCSHLTPDCIDEDELCHNLEKSLARCKDDLYQHITVPKPPAMLPINGIINLPPWIKRDYESRTLWKKD